MRWLGALVLAALPAAEAAAMPDRVECWLSARCDADGCVADGLLVVVHATGSTGAVVQFGAAEERRDVQIMDGAGYLLLTGREGAGGGAFSLRIDDGGTALLSLGGTAKAGIVRHGTCRRPEMSGA